MMSRDTLKKERTGFTMIPNALISDSNITGKAKAIYCYLFSRPDDWTFHVTEISNNFKEGRDAIYSAIGELISTGWIIKTQVKDESGKFSHNEFEIFAYARPVSDESVNGKPVNGEADTNNTDNTNTDITKTDDNKKTSKKEVIELYHKAQQEVEEKTGLYDKDFFVCLDAFKQFQEHRRAIKKPVNTTGPFRLLWNQLIEIRNAGMSINYALEQMKLNEWQTVKLEYLKGVQSSTTNKDPFGFDNA